VFAALSHVEVVTPEDYLADVITDLLRRGARVETQERRGDVLAVGATVPLGGMDHYAADLRALSQGRATYSIRPLTAE
jgi:elongation factor G